MEENQLSPSYEAEFWNQKWKENLTGWDIGYASPAITSFMQDFPNKEASILIPGCGNAYEADFLLENGFTNITLIDISEEKVKDLQRKYQEVNSVNVLLGDFYLHQGRYDVIIEQTFFCANPIESREKYAQKIAQLLNPKGILVGVLFDKDFGNPHPPFGGTKEEYTHLFQSLFSILKMDRCYNSIPPRAGSELFIHFQKK